MSYRILETDEAINDLLLIAINAYDYTHDKQSGENVFDAYDTIVNCLHDFPLGFIGGKF